MSIFRSRKFSFFALILCVSFWVTPKAAKADGNGMAMVAKGLGGALVAVGLFGLYKDITAANADCSNTATAAKCTTDKWNIAKDLLETAGGATAMLANSNNGSQVSAGDTTAGTGSTQSGYNTDPGGTTSGSGSSLSDMCTQQPTMCNTDPKTGLTTLNMPSLGTLQGQLSSAGFIPSQMTDPAGVGLDQALGNLSSSYSKASEAVAAYNAAATNGNFSSASSSGIAGNGVGKDTAGNGVGLDTTAGRAPASAGAAGDANQIAQVPVDTLGLNDLIDKTKKDRGAPEEVTANGLNIATSKDGRLLTIFERVTRAIRGTRDRDLLLAKIEWARKAATGKLGKQNPHDSASNFSVSTTKD